MNNLPVDAIKPKRGRRSKKEILASQEASKNVKEDVELKISNAIIENNINFVDSKSNEPVSKTSSNAISDILTSSINEQDCENLIVKPAAKKRGRKPKGGKIVQQLSTIVEQKESKPNIILHLKCFLKDLQSQGDYNSNFTCSNIENFQFANSNELAYEIINKPEEDAFSSDKKCDAEFSASTSNINASKCNSINYNALQEDEACETKEIWRKLKTLEQNLHLNNVSDKKSACFWCSYDFDNPPIYIPKHFVKDSYHVYGCFCSPECATAHLMEENIDSSTKFERYYLLNHIYSKIYQYSKNIKPAPNPHYMLDKYYGNLTIQEYRALLKSERLFLIVDKPLTRILPEFHEDNDDFIINKKIIPSNNFQLKKKIQKKQQSKNNILNEKFGMPTQ